LAAQRHTSSCGSNRRATIAPSAASFLLCARHRIAALRGPTDGTSALRVGTVNARDDGREIGEPQDQPTGRVGLAQPRTSLPKLPSCQDSVRSSVFECRRAATPGGSDAPGGAVRRGERHASTAETSPQYVATRQHSLRLHAGRGLCVRAHGGGDTLPPSVRPSFLPLSPALSSVGRTRSLARSVDPERGVHAVGEERIERHPVRFALGRIVDHDDQPVVRRFRLLPPGQIRHHPPRATCPRTGASRSRSTRSSARSCSTWRTRSAPSSRRTTRSSRRRAGSRCCEVGGRHPGFRSAVTARAIIPTGAIARAIDAPAPIAKSNAPTRCWADWPESPAASPAGYSVPAS